MWRFFFPQSLNVLMSKYFSDSSDEWPETSGIIESKAGSSHSQQHEQSNEQAVSRVFLGLIFFG